MPLGPPPDTPFYEGDLVSAQAGKTTPVALFGHDYIIDTVKYKRQFVESQRIAQDVSATPGESTLNPEGIWVRSGTDWRFGAGQPRYDGDDVNRSRFERSFGVDVWTQGQVSLLHQTANLLSSATEVTRLLVGPSDQLVVCYVDGTVKVVVSGTPSSVTSLGAGVTQIFDATCDDTTVWLATTDGVWSFPFSTLVATRYDNNTAALAGGPDVQGILLANGRLVCGVGNLLVELQATVPVTVFTHSSSAFRWTVFAEHPQAIYAGGSLGSRCEIFRIGISSTGSLSPPVQALFLPGGEIVQAMVHYVGVMLMVTTRGVRLATVDQDGTLTYGRAIETGSTSEAIYAKGDYVYFAWKDSDRGSITPQTASGVGRLSPQRFGDVEGRVPAYAADLSAPYSARITAVAEHQGKIVFAVLGQGVFQEDTTKLMASGYVETGLIDMDIPYTFQPVDVRISSLYLLGSIDVLYTLWEGTEDDLAVYNTEGNLDSDLMAFPALSARGVTLRFELNRKSDTEGPTMISWLLRVTAQPERVEQILLPIILKEEVSFDDNKPSVKFDPLAEHQRLRSLCLSGQVVTYQEGPTAYRVKVENVIVEPEGWVNDRFRFFNGLVYVQMRVMGDG